MAPAKQSWCGSYIVHLHFSGWVSVSGSDSVLVLDSAYAQQSRYGSVLFEGSCFDLIRSILFTCMTHSYMLGYRTQSTW